MNSAIPWIVIGITLPVYFAYFYWRLRRGDAIGQSFQSYAIPGFAFATAGGLIAGLDAPMALVVGAIIGPLAALPYWAISRDSAN